MTHPRSRFEMRQPANGETRSATCLWTLMGSGAAGKGVSLVARCTSPTRTVFGGGTKVIFGRTTVETISNGNLTIGTNDSLSVRQIGIDGTVQRSVHLAW